MSLWGPTSYFLFFFFNDTATTEIYTLSLHDALPISGDEGSAIRLGVASYTFRNFSRAQMIGFLKHLDRKSTRLNSSHQIISYAVFCLKKKKHEIISSQAWSTTKSPTHPHSPYSTLPR